MWRSAAWTDHRSIGENSGNVNVSAHRPAWSVTSPRGPPGPPAPPDAARGENTSRSLPPQTLHASSSLPRRRRPRADPGLAAAQGADNRSGAPPSTGWATSRSLLGLDRQRQRSRGSIGRDVWFAGLPERSGSRPAASSARHGARGLRELRQPVHRVQRRRVRPSPRFLASAGSTTTSSAPGTAVPAACPRSPSPRIPAAIPRPALT